MGGTFNTIQYFFISDTIKNYETRPRIKSTRRDAEHSTNDVNKKAANPYWQKQKKMA